MASAFHNNTNINFMTDNVALTCILIIRIIYLIVFVTGSVFSLIFLLLAYNDKTYGLAIPVCYYDIKYFKIYLINFFLKIALVDFTWTLGECTISVFSALAESHASSYTSTNNFSYYHSNESSVNWWYTYILNQGIINMHF